MTPWAAGGAVGLVLLTIASRLWPAPGWPGETVAWRAKGRGFLQGLAAGLAALTAIELALAMLGAGRLAQGRWATAPEAAAGWALTALLVAGAQEGWLRGWALARLAPSWGFARAALATSCMFVLLHAEPALAALPLRLLVMGAAGLFLFGLVAAASVRASGSIAWAVGAHAGWDYVGGFILGAPAYGRPSGPGCLLTFAPRGHGGWAAGGAFGPEASPLALVALAAAAWAWLRAPSRPGASH